MYSLKYLIEKFHHSVWDIATGVGDVRSRLSVAYYRFWTIPTDDYPPDLRESREKVQDLMTHLGGPEGYILPHNLEHMTSETASEVADLIVGLYRGLLDLRV
jgi:hypothetical protein